jgi:hypothetical protein
MAKTEKKQDLPKEVVLFSVLLRFQQLCLTKGESELIYYPGPWKMGKPAWFHGRNNDETWAGKIPITAGDYGVVANVFGIPGQGNARLVTAAPKILAENIRLKQQLATAIAFYRRIIAEDGGCDHSVGICYCADLKDVEEMEAALLLQVEV